VEDGKLRHHASFKNDRKAASISDDEDARKMVVEKSATKGAPSGLPPKIVTPPYTYYPFLAGSRCLSPFPLPGFFLLLAQQV